MGISSGEGSQRVFPKNALSGLWHLREGWHFSSSLVGSRLELFQQALMTLSRLDFSRFPGWDFWGRMGGAVADAAVQGCP